MQTGNKPCMRSLDLVRSTMYRTLVLCDAYSEYILGTEHEVNSVPANFGVNISIGDTIRKEIPAKICIPKPLKLFKQGFCQHVMCVTVSLSPSELDLHKHISSGRKKPCMKYSYAVATSATEIRTS
jgi:hypothetical protein